MRVFLLLVCLLPFCSLSQPVAQPDAAEIQLKLRKLNFLGAVLYMAAHPDDENTNVIAWLANERLATTAYLSLTRGDGGQNLIGPEIREWLGVIRTQELLAARRIDGGAQYFTRAIDFGFSKSADEAFRIWGKDAVMRDAIHVIRQFKPDVIITRFPPDERAGHGHHTASAILAGEAFDQAARADIYPDQVEEFGVWKTKRLYTNTGRWWNTSINEDTPGVITLNVGGYNPLLGKSYSEISALSSSQHKSQGWGRAGLRGYRPEFLEYQKGDRAQRDIFEGVDTTWNRVPGGAAVQTLVNAAIANFKADAPWKSVPQLLLVRDAIKGLDDNVWKERKLKEVEQLVVDCLGLHVEATTSHYQGVPGERVTTSVEIINRSPLPVTVGSVTASAVQWDSTFSTTLQNNRPLTFHCSGTLDPTANYSSPYWLSSEHSEGLFTVEDRSLIGRPENLPAAEVTIQVRLLGQTLTLNRPLIYKWVDPVKGERWRPFEIVPPVVVNVSESVLVFGTNEPRTVQVVVKSSSGQPQKGRLEISVPKGWKAVPATLPFDLSFRGAESRVDVTIHPSAKEHSGNIRLKALIEGKEYDRSLRLISYDHFPIQTILYPAEVKAVRIDLKTEGKVVGYIEGAGDEIPAALRSMGYDVLVLADHEITLATLQRLDAVVLGVRALNTHPRARYFMPVLFEYVRQGGTVVVQYNTNQRLEVDKVAPHPLTLGRDRVADETAPVTILAPEHPVITTPNQITSTDFDGWVQERGLYFPSQWDESFQPVLSMADPGEDQKQSSLLVARYGEGYYVYTGLSFFRQLPQGVPGAYKLFANLVSLRDNSGQVEQSKKSSGKQKRK